jgi:hypothetical protein
VIPLEKDDPHIYDKIVEWFSSIAQELSNPQILMENIYNMDETGVMLSKLNAVKVLVYKDNVKTYRGNGVNRTTIAAI